MAKRLCIIALFALMALGILAPSAFAGGSSETCTTGECQFVPATLVPEAVRVETSHGHGSSVKNISITKIKKWKRKYEKTKHVRVNVYEKENGSASTSCVDPTKMSWGFHAGDGFKNHGENGLFNATWIAGWEICDYHIVKKGGRSWAVGEKKNCGNTPIWIPIHFRAPKPRVKTIEVKSYAAFYAKYVMHKRVTTESSSESEHVTTIGRYTCTTGWTLEGSTCKYCPPPHCVPHTCPYGSVWNGYTCVKDGNTTPPPPADAPGKDPPNEGEVGSNQCYWEDTGQPVTPPPKPGEGCPPNSHG